MLPSYRLKNQEDYVVADEYNSYKSSAVKKLPPFIPTTDHSQRIGKLLPYITSMQQRRVNEKEYFMKGNRSSVPGNLKLLSS